VEEDRLRLCEGPATVYDMALAAMDAGDTLARTLKRYCGGETLGYDAIYEGRSEWKLLPPIDFPGEPARCLVTGTGLTHLRGAQSRDEMHDGAALSDSMVMYNWGVAGGRPPAGEVGAAPEWFYKGCGTIVRAHDEPLVVPEFGESGGEESEIAGVYIIGRDGTPRRLGMTAANEFSDHVLERRNYLYLAPSKLRTCALGPELVLDAPFSSVPGRVIIRRGGAVLWERDFQTGEEHMCHTLANLEHHHFRYAQHRRPGDVHVHFFGVAVFSSGEGQRLADGDVMEIAFAGYGRPLRNVVRVEPCARRLVRVEPL
jgi:hypothetical protein